MRLLFAFLATSAWGLAQQYIINTAVGGVPPAETNDAVSAWVGPTFGVTIDASGNTFFATASCIFKVDVKGVMTRVAGTGKPGFSGDGGPAINAQIHAPYGLAVDSSGVLFIADTYNDRIRRVDSAGVINTVAGGAPVGNGGLSNSAPATRTGLSKPWSIAFDKDGDLVIVDKGTNSIRRLSRSGLLQTIAGNQPGVFLSSPQGLAISGDSTIFFADTNNNCVRKIQTDGVVSSVAGVCGTPGPGSSGDGGPAVKAQIETPIAVALDNLGDLLIADGFQGGLRKVDSSGTINTYNENIWARTLTTDGMGKPLLLRRPHCRRSKRDRGRNQQSCGNRSTSVHFRRFTSQACPLRSNRGSR